MVHMVPPPLSFLPSQLISSPLAVHRGPNPPPHSVQSVPEADLKWRIIPSAVPVLRRSTTATLEPSGGPRRFYLNGLEHNQGWITAPSYGARALGPEGQGGPEAQAVLPFQYCLYNIIPTVTLMGPRSHIPLVILCNMSQSYATCCVIHPKGPPQSNRKYIIGHTWPQNHRLCMLFFSVSVG